MNREIRKVVLTGGDCGGKTTSISRISEHFKKVGYRVIVVPETASEVLGSGLTPGDLPGLYFQSTVVGLQLAKEKLYSMNAQKMSANKILLLCDRGILDNRAYSKSDDEFRQICEGQGISPINYRDTYDAVVHLVTAAEGASEAFLSNRYNNPARAYRTIGEAIHLDHATRKAWYGHGHLRVIDNSTDFEHKVTRAINAIAAVLGIPEAFENERKFLIRMPNLAELCARYGCRAEKIVQTYLTSCNSGQEVRVRQRGINGDYSYTLTHKTLDSGIKRLERERLITASEYLTQLERTLAHHRHIVKDRYAFLGDSCQYFELDIYPFWDKYAILEVEVYDADEKVFFPEGIDVVREVTDDPAFRNREIARQIPLVS